MAAGICLPPDTIDKFKQALVKGKIDPERLANMTSEARHKLLAEVVGEGQAKFVNAKFETKLLLKNKQAGYLSWAKQVTGITPEIRRDLISRIRKMDKILNPEEEKAFLKDLADTRLGVNITSDEAKQITNMSTKLQELEAKRATDGTFKTEADRMDYGRAKVAFGSYLADAKNSANKLSVKESILQHPFTTTSKVAGFSKALKASLDNSAIFRQGWKTMWTNPVVWQKNARKSFMDIAQQLGGKDTLKEVQADIISRPNSRLYEKMKLAIGNVEEEFPSTLPEKVPVLGRFYKASEGAYTGFLYRTRADVADKMLQIAKDTGVNINDKKELESIGKLINSLTGRGDLGRLEGSAADALNNVFFSARFLKSNIDTLTAHQLQHDVTPFVRKQAANNLLKIIAGTAAIFSIANMLKPGSVDLDPRSSNFGKIKVGSSKFDVTGGMGSIATLAAQEISGKTKSSTTGVINSLGSAYGQASRFSTGVDFFANKFSPAAGAVRDIAKGKDFNGNKPTVKSTAANLFIPLPLSTAFNKDPHKANQLLISIADGLGIAASGQTPERNVSQNLSKTQQAFKSKVGDKKFQEANNSYNQQYNDWLAAHKDDVANLPQDEQASTITSIKSKIQKKVYKQYNFKAPKSAKASNRKKSLLDSVK